MKSRKKTKLVLVALLAVVTVVSALMCGCSLFDNFDEVKSISLIGTPKTVYAVGDEFDPAGAKIEISYKDKTEGVTKALTADNFDIQFSTEKVGTYQCVVAYKDGGKVYNDITLSFDYSVVAKDGSFTEGDGSQSSPYVVHTAEQFAKIGAEVGKYYVLGGNIDLTKAESFIGKDYVYSSERKCYNNNSNEFVLDGQNYSLMIYDKNEAYVFNTIVGSTVKNLVFNIKPGSANCMLSFMTHGEVEFDNITVNGTMSATANTATLSYWACATKITVKNCTNNVNMTGNAPYISAFLGLLVGNNKDITFSNCVNNGNIEATSSFVFIANGAQKVGSLKIEDCTNTGKLVGSTVGLFNVSGAGVDETIRVDKADYPTLSTAIKAFSLTCNKSDFTRVGKLLMENAKDVTLVNDNGVVKFNGSALTKLDTELGSGYTVKVMVREWVRCALNGNEVGTNYVYTNTITDVNATIPYVKIEQDSTKSADNEYCAIAIENNKLVLAKNVGLYTTTLQQDSNGNPKYQYYCYYVYDNTGAMRYCGQIAYADVQNA